MFSALQGFRSGDSRSTTKQTSLCEECKRNPSKYKCPGCSLRSCSLPCVKSHKLRTQCTGRNQYNDVVPLSKFDDNLLISDYNMLEDAKRVAESAQRMRLKLCGYSHFRLPHPLKYLRNAAGTRKIKLVFLPSGMVKREANRTYYNNRKKFISWTIEWRFHSTDVVLTDHGVHENTSLCSIIENHIKPGTCNQKLKQFSKESLDELKFFIRKFPKGPKSPFRELDINGSLREQLANLVILEYPVIHVFLPSAKYDFQVMKDVVPHKLVQNEPLSPKGVIFKEEEIEDGGCLDTHVSDFMSHVKELKGTEEDDEKCNIDDELDMDFDFHQGLIDAYSDVLAQSNPEDYIDLEGLFPEEDFPEDGDFGNIFPIDEELEEGEIPEEGEGEI